jgi:hypothetical protein
MKDEAFAWSGPAAFASLRPPAERARKLENPNDFGKLSIALAA